MNEQVIKGKIAIIKHTDDGETQIETPEEGAVFEVYLKSANSYADAKDSERDLLTCDENGFAQTKDLPYGIYTVKQTSGWEGRELMKPFDVFINSDGQTYRYLINNANFESYIKIVKKDAETGNTIPYAGAGFQIYDPNGELVTMTFTYPEVTTIDTFYTTADGELITPQTLEYAHYCLYLCGKAKHKVDLGTDPLGNLTRIENELAKIPVKLEAAKTKKAETMEQLETAKIEVEKPFAFEDELKEKSERLNALNIELNLDRKDPAVLDAEPEQSEEPPERKCASRER